MLFRIVRFIVHAEAERHVGILRRRADEDAFCAALGQVQFRFVAAGKEAGGFQHHIRAEIFPRQIAWVAFLENPNFVAADDDVLRVVADLAVEFAMDRIPLEQMRKSVRVGEVVDGGDAFDVALLHRAQDVASDSAEAVDAVICHRKRWLSWDAPLRSG